MGDQDLESGRKLESAKPTAGDEYSTIPSIDAVPVPQSVWQPQASEPGKELIADRYRLIQQIGQGGMGTVWMAQQEKPVRRRVAIKVINNALGCGEAISRFEAERQALAMMNHPNIAKVLDAGTTSDGRPFFVMELVKGVPITQYCNDNHLDNRKRLELMITVCEAVQHAHQKGIIHRDLKPSNILVTVLGEQPVPKVIDFGLAKALESGARLTDQTIVTEFGRVVGTLQYMSPEQAGSNEMDIDTRTDVYSIGVLLYQLLTDIIPLDQQNLTGKYLLQIVELICQSEIPRPSVALARNPDALTAASKQRQLDPKHLIRSLQGELDWIVLKALEKNRVDRYQTANGVALDIKRYLNDEPVTARPPSNAYLLKKFIRKHRALARTIAAVAILLVAGTVVSLYFAIDATRARAKADSARHQADVERQNAVAAEERAKKQFGVFIESFASTDILDGAAVAMSATDVLDNAEEFLTTDLADDPAGRAGMLHEIGRAYRGRSKSDRAVALLNKAYELRSSELGPNDILTLDTLIELAKARMEYGKRGVPSDQVPHYLDETLKMMDDACNGLSKLLPANEPDLMVATGDLGTAYLFAFKEMLKAGISRPDYAEKAISILSTTYERQQEAYGAINENVLSTRTNLTNALLKGGNVKQAISMSVEVLNGWSKLLEMAAPGSEKRRKLLCRISKARNNYGESLQADGQFERAMEVYRLALKEKDEAFGVGHGDWLSTVRGMLDTLVESGQLESARELFESTKEQLENDGSVPDKLVAIANLERIKNEIMNNRQINDDWTAADKR